MSDCFRYCIFFSIASLLVFLFSKDYIINIVLDNSIPINLLYLLAISIPFCSLSSCLNGYFMAKEKIWTVITSQTIEVFLQIIIVVIFYYCNMLNTTYNICLALILGLVISDLISFIYLLRAYLKDYKKIKKLSESVNKFKKEICKISIPVALTTYIKSGLSTIKTTLIPIAFVQYGFSYNDALSYYGLISSTIMTLILFPFTFIQSYSNMLIPKLSTYDIKKDRKKVLLISKKSILLTFLFSLCITIILISSSSWIDKYLYKTLNMEFYLKILAPIIIYIYIDNVIDSLLKSLNLQVFVMIINIIDLIISIYLIKFLIPIFGVNGYIFILYFSEIFNFTVSLFVLNRHLNNNHAQKNILTFFI